MCELDRFLIARYNDGQRPEVRNSSKCQVVDVIWLFAVRKNVRCSSLAAPTFYETELLLCSGSSETDFAANRFPIRALVRDRRYPDKVYALESPPSKTA
jgi:hypothetical protein